MNRIRDLTNKADDEDAPYGDGYLIEVRFSTYRVTADVARYVERRIDQTKPPVWLVFRDHTGARLRIRTEDVRAIRESSEKTRARARRLSRAARREEKADRQWEEGDDET